LKADSDTTVAVFAQYVLKKLVIIMKSGPRGRIPTIQEIARQRDAPLKKSIFGVTLTDVMEIQEESDPNLKIPKIVPILTKAVEELEGFNIEGIFRVPGDTEQVLALRVQMDNGNYEIHADDANIPASLLKLWMRELEDPIVPVHL